jgi:uncharacterized RDD family membrane protein YckC
VALLCVATTLHAQPTPWDTDALEHGRRTGALVSIGHDSRLAAGHEAASVVSILGSSAVEGDATDVVSILGNSRLTGLAHGDVVAVLGNTYIDGRVDGDAVAVLGNVDLGPHAEVDGDVAAVLGSVRRDPAAVVRGDVQSVLGGEAISFGWFHSWFAHCLLLGRPLAWLPELAWAWYVALAFLALYACLALLFPAGIRRCVQTFEAAPGRAFLAALIATLLTPVLITLLCVTLVGIAAVPFLLTALFCMGLFGRAVMLAWFGGRILRGSGPALGYPVVAVLLGGAAVLALYVVPVLGMLVYQLLGFLGFGAVVYALTTAFRQHQRPAAEMGFSTSGGAPAGGGAQASSPSGTPAGPAMGAAPSAFATSPRADAPGAAAPDAARPRSIPDAPSMSAAAAPANASMPRAGFWIRMAALLVDMLLVGIATSVLDHANHWNFVFLAAYGAAMWKLRGTTVGGIIFDLRVVRLDGRSVDWETAIVRALGCFLSLAVAGLGFIWIAFDDGRQAWHDKIAGTAVVRIPKSA